MMLMRAVSDETINLAKSLTDKRGSWRTVEEAAMDDILASMTLGNGKSIHLASLARETVIDCGAEHLGCQGYFLFESSDEPGTQGINVLGKVASYDAAMRLIDVFNLA